MESDIEKWLDEMMNTYVEEDMRCKGQGRL